MAVKAAFFVADFWFFPHWCVVPQNKTPPFQNPVLAPVNCRDALFFLLLSQVFFIFPTKVSWVNAGLFL